MVSLVNIRPKMHSNLQYFKTELETKERSIAEIKGKSCSLQTSVQRSALLNLIHLHL